jgi:hypothetical protein
MSLFIFYILDFRFLNFFDVWNVGHHLNVIRIVRKNHGIELDKILCRDPADKIL